MASQKNKKQNQKAVRTTKDHSEEPWLKTLLLMAGILLAYYIYAIEFGEKLPVNNGLGWDGALYGNIIQHFKNSITQKQLYEFTIGRTLPLAVIYYSMKFFGIALTNANIVLQFQIFNSLLLLISVGLWIKIAKHLKLSQWGAWLGFLGLFINFANLKNSIYASVSTDPATFFLGVLMLFLFLKNKRWGILITSILGAFVSPTMVYFGMLLFIFKEATSESQKNEEPDTSFSNIIRKYQHLVIPFFICLAILFGIVYSTFIIDFPLPNETVAPIDRLLVLSIISITVFLFVLLAHLFDHKNASNILKILKSVNPYRLAIFIVIFLLLQYIYKHLGKPNIDIYTLPDYVKTIIKAPVVKPFITIVAAIVFYGPLLLLLFSRTVLKKLKSEIHKYNYGLFFAIIVGFLLLFLDPESRHSAFIYPFFCAFIVKAIDKQISKPFLLAFIVLSVIFSKIWFPINPIPSEPSNQWEFPMQKYSMNFGPWMANQPYAIQGFVVLCSFLIIFFFIKKGNNMNERKYKTIEQSIEN